MAGDREQAGQLINRDRVAAVVRWVVLAGAALLLWLTRFFTAWPETYLGSGPSMEPTVRPGDSVFLLSDTRDIIGWPDSRFLGFIPKSALEAEARRMLWSPSRRGMILRRLR